MANYSLPDPDLTTVLRGIGRGSVFYATRTEGGDVPVYWDGTDSLFLTWLGDTEGEIQLVSNPTHQNLTLPELTGEAPVESSVQGEAPILTIPIFYADPALRAIVSPTGTASGGYPRQRPVEERTIVVFPEEIFYNSTTRDHDLTIDTNTGVILLSGVALTAAQQSLLDVSLWLWRCYFRKANQRFRHEERGKLVENIECVVMVDSTKPNGHWLYTVGNPYVAGIDISPAS